MKFRDFIRLGFFFKIQTELNPQRVMQVLHFFLLYFARMINKHGAQIRFKLFEKYLLRDQTYLRKLCAR